MRRSALWLLLCAALVAVWTVSPPPAAWLDRVYGGVVYPAVAGVLVPLTGAFELPVTALLIAALLLWLVLRSVFSKRTGRSAVWRGLWQVLVGAATLAALFIVLWGANYGRTPVETRLNLSAGVTPEPFETAALARALAAILRDNAAAPEVWDADLASARSALRRVTGRLEGRAATLPRHVKRTPPGFLIFTGGATGLTVPWTLEAYVDRALPYPAALATALHELAHVAGYAGEAEADFVAALAGLSAESPSLRYAVAQPLFLRAAQTLPPEGYRTLFETLPARTRADIAELGDAYRRHRAPQLVARVQTLAYDGYLRSQRVGAGVADYDRVTVLLAAAARDGVLTFAGNRATLALP